MTTTRLTALDEAFLAFESARTPAHVGSVARFEGGPFRDDDGRFLLAEVRSRVESRLHLVPRLRQVVETTPFGLARPLLVDHPSFDIAHHVKLTEVPSPGGEAELFGLACELHMEPLDRSRPLWELWFVDGLVDGSIGLIEKIHHAIVDGVSGVEVSMVLLDLEPDPPPIEVPRWRPEPEPGPVRLAASGIADRLEGPAGALTDLVRAGTHPGQTAAALRRDLRALRSTFRRPLRAPACSLNQQIGATRRLAAVRRPLAAIRERAHDRGATVNDLVLSVVAGGMRHLLVERDELEPEDEFALRVLVPVSLHDEPGQLGNQVAGLVVDLPLTIAEPGARLRAISDDLAEHKRSGEAPSSARLLSVADLLPPRLARMVSRGVNRQPFVNLVVTNVPGPGLPLYAMGARMLDAVPVVPLGGNLTVSIGVLSYDGQLALGVYADVDTFPDLDVLIEGMEAAFDEHGVLAVGAAGAPVV